MKTPHNRWESVLFVFLTLALTLGGCSSSDTKGPRGPGLALSASTPWRDTVATRMIGSQKVTATLRQNQLSFDAPPGFWERWRVCYSMGTSELSNEVLPGGVDANPAPPESSTSMGGDDTTDNDKDKDGFTTEKDNCPDVFNPDQSDLDHDGIGDACDPTPLGGQTLPLQLCGGSDTSDTDADGICSSEDNCPNAFNPNQADLDGDGIGDVCDPTPLGDLGVRETEQLLQMSAGDEVLRVSVSYIRKLKAPVPRNR